MQAFAALLDRLVLTPQRNAKLRLMADYFRSTPDPDRGYALAALTGDLDIPSVKPAMLRALVTARVDETLFTYSYDYVGDLAETIALIWPANAEASTAAPSPGSPDDSPAPSPFAPKARSARQGAKPSPTRGEGGGGNAGAADAPSPLVGEGGSPLRAAASLGEPGEGAAMSAPAATQISAIVSARSPT